MADEAKDQETPESAEPPKKSSALPLIIMAVALVLLGGGGFFAYTKLMASKPAAVETQKAEVKKTPPDSIGEMHAMNSFTVNLADPKGKRYIKLKLELEMDTLGALERVQQATPKLRDTVIVMLTSLSFEEVMTPEGKIRIRDELLVRFNQILKPERLKNIYFTEFLVQ